MRDRTMDSLNTPIYFKLTRIVAFTDVILALTDTIVTALIFFGDDQDTFKSLYYKIVKQQGILVFHSEEEVRWNQSLASWLALVVTTMLNLIWFNSSCYLLYSTKKTCLSVGNRLNYCRSWLLISSVLLVTYSIHIFTNGQEVPTALLASLVALVYRVFVICIVYGLFLHLEESVRPFFSTPDGVYLEGASVKLRVSGGRKKGESDRCSVRTSVHIPHQPLHHLVGQEAVTGSLQQHIGGHVSGGYYGAPCGNNYSPQDFPRHEYIYHHQHHPNWAFQVRHV